MKERVLCEECGTLLGFTREDGTDPGLKSGHTPTYCEWVLEDPKNRLGRTRRAEVPA